MVVVVADARQHGGVVVLEVDYVGDLVVVELLALGEQVGNGGRFLEVLDLVREQILVDVLVANVLVIALLA